MSLLQHAVQFLDCCLFLAAELTYGSINRQEPAKGQCDSSSRPLSASSSSAGKCGSCS